MWKFQNNYLKIKEKINLLLKYLRIGLSCIKIWRVIITYVAGFFDDEDIDARVQGKDTPMEKLDKEYELFQHEMKVDEQKIEDIKDEEHEKKNIDRYI